MNDFKVGELVMVFTDHKYSLKPHLGIVIEHRTDFLPPYVVVLQDGRKRSFSAWDLEKLLDKPEKS